MGASNSVESSVTLKLLIDTKEKRVVFAEAGKDFADFLFTLLSLPIGTVIRLLSANGMVGTLGKLYRSFESLNDTMSTRTFSSKQTSSIGSSSSSATLLPLTDGGTPSVGKRLFICGSCISRGSDERPGARCTGCGNTISRELTYVAPKAPVEGGFVKGEFTYVVMDNLEVKPMSTIPRIAMLDKFNIKDIGALKEKTVSVGIKEGLNLLKASLQVHTVLTNVFLRK